LDEALQRSGASLRERLLDGERPPAAVPDGVLEEAFRRWLPELEVIEQRLLRGSADLSVPAGASGDAPGEMGGPPTSLVESALGRGLLPPAPPATPAIEQPAPTGQEQSPADEPEAALWEKQPHLVNVFLAAGFVSGVWLQRQRRRVGKDRPGRQRQRRSNLTA